MLKQIKANAKLIRKKDNVFIQIVLLNNKFAIAAVSKSNVPMETHFIYDIFLSAILEKKIYEINISRKYIIKDETVFNIIIVSLNTRTNIYEKQIVFLAQ